METYKDILDQLFVYPVDFQYLSDTLLDKLTLKGLDIIPELLERCRSWPSFVTSTDYGDEYNQSFNYRLSDVFVELGNKGYEIVPLLIGYLNDENESDAIRLAAAHSLLLLGEDVFIVENQMSYLLWVLKTYSHERNYKDYLGIVTRIFGQMGESPVIRLMEWMVSEDPHLRYLAMVGIVWTGDSSRISFPLINKLLRDEVAIVRYHAVSACYYIMPNDEEIISTLKEIVRKNEKIVGYNDVYRTKEALERISSKMDGILL